MPSTLSIAKQGSASLLFITAFNRRREHFYQAILTNDDGTYQTLFSGNVEGDVDQISRREQDILKWVSRRESSESMGRRLGISCETVKTHRKTCYKRRIQKMLLNWCELDMRMGGCKLHLMIVLLLIFGAYGRCSGYRE